MYTMNMNKQTLNERFEDYTEDTKQEEIWSDESKRQIGPILKDPI